MAKKFQNLRDNMSQERRDKVASMANEMLAGEMALIAGCPLAAAARVVYP